MENSKLKSQIEEFDFSKDKLHSTVVLFPRSNKLKPGELYEAAVFQTFREEESSIRVILYDKTPNPKFADTLVFEATDRFPEIAFEPQDTGHYKLSGNFTQKLLGVEYNFPIEATFDVK